MLGTPRIAIVAHLCAAVVSRSLHAQTPPQRETNVRDSIARSPGAIIVTTNADISVALRFADKLADGGITVLVRRPSDDTPTADAIATLRFALDSLRRRNDVDPRQTGIITIGDATTVLAGLVSDTTLAFVVSVHTSASSQATARELANYGAAKVPTLVLRPRTVGIDTASMVTSQTIVHDAPDGVGQTLRLIAAVGQTVTIWPLSNETLSTLGEPLTPTVGEVVSWVQQRVARPGADRPPSAIALPLAPITVAGSTR